MFPSISQDITNLSIIKNTLYHHNWFCKLLKMTWSIFDRKADEFRTSGVTIAIAVVVVICFRCVFINISLNFIYFIIENRLYCLDYACKLLKTKLINLGHLKLLFLLRSLWSLVCGNLFFISSVKLPVTLLLLFVLDRFVCFSNRLDLLLIEKLVNLSSLELLLLAPLLPVAPSCFLCPMPRSFVYVCCACA